MRTPAQVIGGNVKAAREHRGMTAKELGEKVGEIFGKTWPRQTVYLLEQGERRLAAEEVVALAYVLDVSITELFIPPSSVDQVQVGRWKLPREWLLTDGKKDSEQLYEVARHMQALDRSMRDIFSTYRAQQWVMHDIDRALRGEPPYEVSAERPDDPIQHQMWAEWHRRYEQARLWYEPEHDDNGENR
jgi:transcriptional regulator with XRE-family HTH domain